MVFSVSNFKSDIIKRGVMRSNRFIARFAPPKFLTDKTNYPTLYQKYKPEDLSIRCEAASTPGISLQTVEGPFRYGYGTVDKQAVGMLYEPLSLTFICDRAGQVQEFFHDWMNFIYSFSTGGKGADGDSIVGSKASQDSEPRKAYEVQYKSNFATDLFIEIYDELDRRVMVYRAYKVYPERVNNIDLDWNEDNGIVKMQIPFVYKDYDIQFVERPSPGSNLPPRGDEFIRPPQSIHAIKPNSLITKP